LSVGLSVGLSGRLGWHNRLPTTESSCSPPPERSGFLCQQTNMNSVRHPVLAGLFLSLLLLVAGCRTTPQDTVTFRLPQGDIQNGKLTFISLKCYACHRVVREDVPPPYALPPVPVVLGAEPRQLTRQELAQAIVAPSHTIEPGYRRELVASGHTSRMADFAALLTLQQLADLVAFLQSLYEI